MTLIATYHLIFYADSGSKSGVHYVSGDKVWWIWHNMTHNGQIYAFIICAVLVWVLKQRFTALQHQCCSPFTILPSFSRLGMHQKSHILVALLLVSMVWCNTYGTVRYLQKLLSLALYTQARFCSTSEVIDGYCCHTPCQFPGREWAPNHVSVSAFFAILMVLAQYNMQAYGASRCLHNVWSSGACSQARLYV